MRATSNHTRYVALWATPWASVSANRTTTSVWKLNPSTPAYYRRRGCRAPRRADQGPPAVRSADGRGRVDRERNPRLPVADWNLGSVRPDGVRHDRGIPARPRQGLGLLRQKARRAEGGQAEC